MRPSLACSWCGPVGPSDPEVWVRIKRTGKLRKVCRWHAHTYRDFMELSVVPEEEAVAEVAAREVLSS